MVDELSFSHPQVTPEGLSFEARGPHGRWRFVLPRESFAALGARPPRMRDLLATFQRWRARILGAAARLALAAGTGTGCAAPIVITGEALGAPA